MLISMTGFGRGEAAERSEKTGGALTVTAEARSINSRFIEISVRLPRSMSERELEVRELVRKSLERGKISIGVNILHQGAETIPLAINEAAARGYYELLDRLRTVTGITAEIQLKDLTSFSEVFTADEATSNMAQQEWRLAEQAIRQALETMSVMRKQEGGELEIDLRGRVKMIDESLTSIEELVKNSGAEELRKLKERVAELTRDMNVINNERLELEVALMAERLDVTEEIVRFRSHIKFFIEAVEAPESAGRKLNFILQEMNREANTIGSKTNLASVAQKVVGVKQELEKMREQVQNIE